MNPLMPAATKLTSVPQIPAEATDSRTPAPSGSSASTTRIPLSVFITALMFRSLWISDDVRIHWLGDKGHRINALLCSCATYFVELLVSRRRVRIRQQGSRESRAEGSCLPRWDGSHR